MGFGVWGLRFGVGGLGFGGRGLGFGDRYLGFRVQDGHPQLDNHTRIGKVGGLRDEQKRRGREGEWKRGREGGTDGGRDGGERQRQSEWPNSGREAHNLDALLAVALHGVCRHRHDRHLPASQDVWGSGLVVDGRG